MMQYVVIDYLWYRKLKHGWFKTSAKSPGYDLIDKWGRPLPDPKRWPSTTGGKGFAPIAAKVHALGLKLGIHVMRGISTTAVKKKTPILGAFKSNGHAWNAKDIALMDQACPWMQQCFVGINTSSEGGKLFIQSLYDQYASWGIDFIKHDCVFGAENPQLDEILTVSKAIRNSGRPMIYSLSPGDGATPGLAARVAQLVNMYRVTGDDWDDWKYLVKHFDVARYQELHSLYSVNLHCFRDFADAGLIAIPSVVGGKSWVDLDMLPFGRLTDPVAKSPLMFGGDLRRLDNETLSLLTNPTVLEVNSHSTGNRNAQGNDAERVWVAHGRGNGQIYIAFFNLSRKKRTVTLPLVHLIQRRTPKNETDEYVACAGNEAWSQKPVAVINVLAEEVAGHGTVLFSLLCNVGSREEVWFASVYNIFSHLSPLLLQGSSI
ncbi:alpha-galactosidase [Selaginella moellendorffii]|uniref:alpha-galactosidase n=1 Tax=Selaginella moellendorffii TaxID=88036 RepID=UPI000D1CE799|nr:alpha-galactosidase [Selaginella moellendorffii]|eukprot:XP_024523258.1 alpha-galactosidase [Selaginella moellendorffii]